MKQNQDQNKSQVQTAGFPANEKDMSGNQYKMHLESGDSTEKNRYVGRGDSDAEAHRDAGKSHNYKGEADNVNDDSGRPLSETDTDKARNKATEGLRQQRNND